MQEPQPLEISGKARRALDAICDTFVPGEDGLPSATDRGVPEAMLMAVGSSPSKATSAKSLIFVESRPAHSIASN